MLRPSLSRPPGVDVLLALFYAAVVVLEAFTDSQVTSPALHALVGGIAMLLLAWRRTYPLWIAVAVVVALIVLVGNGAGGLSVVFGLLVMSFTVGSETEGRTSWLGLGVLAVPFCAALMLELEEAAAGDVGAVVTIAVVPWVAGRALRQRAEHLARAIAHTERLEGERERAVERATEQERTRLARELHDVVSHSISVVAIQAQAVRRRLRADQEREAADLANLEAAAREAMAEMRRLFGVLRQEGEGVSLAPQPGLAELDRLVGQVRGTGIDVVLVIEGDVVELPPGLDLAAYRIVQEAVTNAMRHSGARCIRVCIGYRPGEIVVAVEDDGRGFVAVGEPGHGLRGIRERAELYGGTLDVGPGTSGGTRVHARLPVRSAS